MRWAYMGQTKGTLIQFLLCKNSASLKKGSRVLLLDDLLATGGTMEAMVKLTKKLGADPVALSFVIELTGLAGRKRLEDEYGFEVFSLISFPGH